MPNSLELSAYRAIVRRNPPTRYEASQKRPLGEVLWLHAPENGNALALFDLAKRLCAQRHDLSVLITCDGGLISPCHTIIIDTAPSEHPQDIAAFLDHWRPDVALWLWGNLRPNLILATHQNGVPFIMADADQQGFESRRDRWLPEVARDVMACFDNVLARTEPAHARLSKLMRSDVTLELSGPIVAGGQSLDYEQSDFDTLSTALGGRPVWLAASVQSNEIQTVLAAHRHALRLSHRLLLVLNPASEEQAAECQSRLSTEGLRSARWDDGEMPDDNCQVLLATAQNELGLWYRVAPLSFLGSSLSSGQHGLDPFQAAALGTAILYGPNVRNHMPSYTRLAAAGAARIVNDAGALGVAVARLISPDHAASMAMSGWDIVSQGAAITDRITELVINALDAAEERGT
jgi:3-deoxy-D-manno-octulosonic-acid transferase|tara:strand:+ start:367 stop:1581 length:1215 start_codon:yes stop_codon:yes gene_type:complete